VCWVRPFLDRLFGERSDGGCAGLIRRRRGLRLLVMGRAIELREIEKMWLGAEVLFE